METVAPKLRLRPLRRPPVSPRAPPRRVVGVSRRWAALVRHIRCTGACSASSLVLSHARAYSAAYYGDLEALDAALDAVPESQWTALDCCGNTALHVAVLREQRAAVERLLARGFPPAAKSAGGWGPVHYAIAGGNGELVAALHVATVRSREAEYRQRKPQLLAELAALPDFRGSLKWEFCSPLFGTLLRRFAPHDTYTVTKRGACLRVDGTLKGFAEDSGDSLLPSWDRGAFSLLFDGQAVADAAAREHATGASSPASRDAQGRQLALWLVDHDKQEVVDALPPGAQRSESELHEEAAQMLAQGATKAKLHAREFSFAPVKTWRGGMRRESAEGWPSAVYEARGVLESQHLLAGARRDTCRGSFQHYLATTGGAAAGGDTVQTFDFSDQAGEESRPHSGVAGADGSPFPSPPPSPRSSEESSPDGSPAPGASPADATHSERGKAPKASSKPSKPRAFKGTIWMVRLRLVSLSLCSSAVVLTQPLFRLRVTR